MQQKVRSFYYLIICGWIIGWRCVYIILRAYLGKISHQEMNRLVKSAAESIFTLTRTNYLVSYQQPLQLNPNVPLIFMSNHQSLIDIPLIYANVNGTIRFIAKKELFKIPIFGKMLKISECIPIDRSKPAHNTDFYQQVKEKLTNKIHLWIFPEGTRSRSGELLPFKKGGFRLANEISALIIPVGINNTRAVLPPGKFIFSSQQTTEIKIGKPIDTKNYQLENNPELLIETVRQAIKELMN